MCNKILFEQICRGSYIKGSFKSIISFPNYYVTNSSHLQCSLPNIQDLSKTTRSLSNTHTVTSNYNFAMQSFITGQAQNTNHLMGMRYYCTEKQPQIPKQMEFPQVVWPSMLKTVRNWVLSNFIINRYFDGDFSLPEFVDASKQAVQLVSGLISRGEIDNLSGLVTTEVIHQVRQILDTFTLKQQQQFFVRSEDIYFCFPYEVGVMFPNEDRKDGVNQTRFVEITMCYHVLLGLKEMRDANVQLPVDLGLRPEYQDKLFVCNYRFIREFTKGVQDDWTINAINHFKPATRLNL